MRIRTASTSWRRSIVGAAVLTLVGLLQTSGLAQAQVGPIILLPAGQVVPLPPAGTASEMPLPAYDKDDDTRNEWSKREFPHQGECRWMPVEWGGKPTAGKDTPAERQAIQRALEKAIAFLKTAPVANPPIGICPWVGSAGSDGAVDLGFALTSSFSVANWASTTLSRDKPGGRVIRGELLHLNFTFNAMPGNRISPYHASPFEMVDAEGEFFPEGQPTGLFQGFPAYFALDNADENYLVIPLNNRPLFRPVRVGRMIRWQLAQFDKEITQLQASLDGARREYDGFFTPTAQADEERIIARRIENDRARTPELQARIRASREAEVAAKTKALREKWDVAAKPGHPFNVATRRKTEAQARLASLSEADAQSPACLVKREESYVTPDIARTGNASCAFTLVERNPDYYDKTLPRTAPQILVISRFSWVPPVGGLPGQRRRYTWGNRHMLWGLDWQKFRRDVLGATTPFDVAAVAPYTGTPRSLPKEVAAAAPRVTVASPDSPAVAPASAPTVGAPPAVGGGSRGR